MKEQERLLMKLEQYKRLVHTQEEADAAGLWADHCDCSLISGGTVFKGTEAIQKDFLGLIRQAYSEIQLVSDQVEIRMIDDRCALIVFEYHTECTRRETNEPYGILGLETQIYVKEQDDWRLVHVQYSGKPVSSAQ